MPEHPVAIITGAARGIGEATALRFAQKGYCVTLVDRDAASLQDVAQRVAAHGVESLCCAGDLQDLAFAQSAIQQTVAKWGRIDVLVNNAAWREVASMRRISLESWEKSLRVNITVPAFMARWAAETMENSGGGVIVNVSSAMSRQAAGICPAYIASKGAIDALTYELASLYGPSSIRVVAVNPGAVDTDMSRDLAKANGADDPTRAYSKDMIMLKRWAKPDEIARTIVSICSDDASYLTGTTVVLDGGWSRQHLPLSLRRTLYNEDFA